MSLFFLYHFKYFMPFSFCLCGFLKRNLMYFLSLFLCRFYVRFPAHPHPPPTTFKIFFLVLILCSLNMICVFLDFWIFVMLGFLWASWISDLVSTIHFGKLSVINMATISLISSFFWYFYCVYVTPLVIVPHFLGIVFYPFYYFICLYFNVGCF